LKNKVTYTLIFAGIVCMICSVLVSTAAVALSERQEKNQLLDKQANVLQACGLIKPGEEISSKDIEERFKKIKPLLISTKTGELAQEGDPATHDWVKASKDPDQSYSVSPNPSKVKRVPNLSVIYQLLDDDSVTMYVFPIEGMGLWSTLRGFIALDAQDLNSVRGLTYYSHGETPGLGGEVDNPKWKALWNGRKVFDASGKVVIQVIKGTAGNVQAAPHQIDGLSGATITSRGVSNMLNFWLGETGYGPFLDKLKGIEVL